MDRNEIVMRIVNERARQEELKRAGKIPFTCVDGAVSSPEKCVVLTEECGEVARAVQRGDHDNLRDELVQVAAVCMAWLEAL